MRKLRYGSEMQDFTYFKYQIKWKFPGIIHINKDTLSEEDIGELIKRIEINHNSIHIFYNFESMKAKKIPVKIEHSE